MKKKLLLSTLLLYVSLQISAQYEVKCKHILDPDLNIEYVKKNMDFWISHAYDPIYGGFFSSVGVNGTLLNSNRKSLICQTRHGYGFTRAFMLTGDEMYLDYANSALNFLFASGWDTTNEGWYCFANQDGTLDNRSGWNPNNKKWGFQQHYAMLGIIANYEATQDTTVKKWMDLGMNSLYKNLWDSRPGFEGYYDDAAVDWSTKTGKGFTATVDGITTNAELNYLVTGTPESKERLLQLADNIVDHFISTMSDPLVKVLYPEKFSTDWVPDFASSGNGSIGHFIKTSWCLGRAYLCDTTKTQYRDGAIEILDKSWAFQNGTASVWDKVNGGPFNEIDILTGNFKANGDSKDYWTVEQGFTSGMLNHYITKNPIYLQMADESLNFFMKHIVDSINGEIFSQTNPNGLIVRNKTKGDDFKASYHSTELGYLAYLYSSLYLLNKPANLYYKFAPSEDARVITLKPIPIEDRCLSITSVTLDGEPFNDFDPASRSLFIAPNQGGKFKVTYESIPSGRTGLAATPDDLKIRVFPNPTRNNINISGAENVNRITIMDLAGKVVLEQTSFGQTSISINLENLQSGVYMVVLNQNSGAKSLRKIIKM